MSANVATPLFNFYLRYPWGPSEFEDLQESLVELPRDSFGALHGAGLLYGGVVAPSGSTMGVTVTAHTSLNDDGYLCATASTQLVAIDASHATLHRYDLIVARPSLVNGTMISRPTTPFESVALTTLQKCVFAVVKGTNGASPSPPAKVAGDVILATVYIPATSTSITSPNINQTTGVDIGNCVRFSSSAKGVSLRARDGTTDTLTLISNGTGRALRAIAEGPALAGDFEGVNGFAVRGHATNTFGGAFISDNAIGLYAQGEGTGGGSDDIALQVAQNIDFAGANPASNIGFQNVLTPLHFAKAWAILEISGGAVTILGGVNVASVALNGTTQIELTLSDAVAAANNTGVQVSLMTPLQNYTPSAVMISTTIAAINGYSVGGVQTNFATTTTKLLVVVYGAQ